MPQERDGFAGFVNDIAAAFTNRGIQVALSPVCRLNHEFSAAIKQFEEAGVDAIVTLHLAYSPSLEAIDACCRTDLPLIILDTTMDAAFGVDVDASRIMFNHGVHGVMDFASMLCRHQRPFEIVAGHFQKSDVIDRAAGLIRGTTAANAFKNSRLLRVGDAFSGMGDFAVNPELLHRRFGITVEQIMLEQLDAATAAISAAAVDAEIAADQARFKCELNDEIHRRSVRIGLGLRALLENGDYDGFSVNFQAFNHPDRVANTMPFLEISKAMARGIGYAGEGDVLTAALVGALAKTFDAVTFTEIFCPDWQGGNLFLSHMGEISPTVLQPTPRIFGKPAFDHKTPDAAVLTGAVTPGPASYVNLAPGPDDSFSLIIAPVDILPETSLIDVKMHDTVRAWVRPRTGLAAFLEDYARAGGTHHSALVLGVDPQALASFGRALGFNCVML
jgi:L-arabinose isomerase